MLLLLSKEATVNNKPVIYEDVSLERGSFLVQQTVRLFLPQNLENAESTFTFIVSKEKGKKRRTKYEEVLKQN